ncbi:MAG: hypothetical protein AAFY15_09725 [Cyanobacteria bacterium J06648_11]
MSMGTCKVCGAWTVMEADTCHSCGFSPQGRKRSPIYTWAALLLASLFVMALVGGAWRSIRGGMQRRLPPEAPAQQA